MKPLQDLVDAIDSVVIEALSAPTSGNSLRDAANDAVRAAGYSAIEHDQWLPIVNSAIHAVLTFRIGHDLAYSSDQLLPVEQCQTLASALIAHADQDTRWFTNRGPTAPRPDGTRVTGSSPISNWTFDAAYVGVGKSNTLFICFFAED